MKEQAVSYRDFTKGEYGTMGLFQAPPGTFHATNLLRSPQGYLYPRPGTKAYSTTTLPTGTSHALGWTGVPGRDLWTLIDDTVYHRDSTNFAAGGWTAATGTLTSAPNEQVWWIELTAGITYLLVPGQGLYVLNLTSGPGTLTHIAAVTTDMAGYGIGTWGTRLFIGGWSPGNRVYYSASGDFGSWSAADYFDVGPAPQVRFVGGQRQALSIVLQDGSMWSMNGSTPATGTLRRVIGPQGTWHFWPNMAIVLPDDNLWFVPNQGTWPAVMDGVQAQELRHLRYAGPAGNVQGEQNVIGLHLRDEVALISGLPGERGQSMFLSDKTWTYQAIGGSIAGGVATDGQGSVFLHDGGGVGVKDNVYRLNMKDEGGAGDLPGGAKAGTARGDVDSGTPVSASLELPGWWDETGLEWLVRQVIVHVRKFNIGGGVDNELSMIVDAHGHEEVSNVRSSATYTWAEATASGTAGGVRDRIVWNVGDQGPGQGFQVRFPTLVGLGIVEVIVKLEATADQPRS